MESKRGRGARPVPPGYLTRQALATRWGVTVRSVSRYLSGRRPLLPSYLIAGRRLVRLGDVESYESSRRNGKGRLGPQAHGIAS